MTIDQAIAKIREVALDLREPQDGANLSHQADKLDRVIKELEKQRKPRAVPEVHGGGTGKE